MRELSREASELLDAGRYAFRAHDADRARVLAAITGAATLAGGAAVASAAKLSWAGFRWAQVLAVAIPVAAGGVYLARNAMGSAGISVAPPRVTARVRTPLAAEAPTVEPPSESAVAVPSARPIPPSIARPRSSPQIGQEVALLSKAQAELSSGRANQALLALAEHAQRFPAGALAEERMATRSRALCALGRVAEAETELSRVERRNPGSAYLPRAREACRK